LVAIVQVALQAARAALQMSAPNAFTTISWSMEIATTFLKIVALLCIVVNALT
jgi:hypothetical protein